MIKFKINVPRAAYYVSSPEDLYSKIVILSNGDEWLAIEISSWAELACIGEEYDADDFTVEVIEE